MVHGGLVEKTLDSYRTSIMKQIDKVKLQLEENLAKLELKKKELEQHKQELTLKMTQLPEDCLSEDFQLPYTLYLDWNLESCLNLTGDWEAGGLQLLKCGIFVLNVTDSFENSVGKMAECPLKEITKLLPCYYYSFLDFVDDMTNLKKELVPFVEHTGNIAGNMSSDFHRCLGIHYNLRETLLTHLDKNNCQQ